MKIPEWTQNLTIYEVNLRQYTTGGTIKEFREHLPRLQELGVGILWFMPIQPIGIKNRKGTMGSYYSIRDYCNVDPFYGSLAEFKALVDEIHEMGMYVILDWVANHTAWDHHWTKSNPEYYTKNEKGEFLPPNPDWSDVLHLNYSVPELQNAMIESMKFWLKETNIDGFRCDMAHLVPTWFWNKAKAALDSLKPVFMLAESENRDLLEHAFHVIYSWKIHHYINKQAKGKSTVFDLDNLLNSEIFEFPKNVTQMFFTSNHDENSWNGSALERLTFGLETFNVFIFTMPGLPLIYSGQEAGFGKRLLFFDKDYIIWKDDKMAYLYKILVNLKKRNPALWHGQNHGDFIRLFTSSGKNVFAFIRRKSDSEVFVILNFSQHPVTFNFNGNELKGIYTDIFSKGKVIFSSDNQIELPQWGYKVYEK